MLTIFKSCFDFFILRSKTPISAASAIKQNIARWHITITKDFSAHYGVNVFFLIFSFHTCTTKYCIDFSDISYKMDPKRKHHAENAAAAGRAAAAPPAGITNHQAGGGGEEEDTVLRNPSWPSTFSAGAAYGMPASPASCRIRKSRRSSRRGQSPLLA